MELSKLLNVRKFIRETLNLADTAQIKDFALETKGGLLTVKALIALEIDISTLSTAAPTLGAPALVKEGRSKFKVRQPKQKGNYAINREFKANIEDFKAMRVLLGTWRKKGILTTQEVEVMASFAGQFFATMEGSRRQEFLNYFTTIQQDVVAGNRTPKKEE